MIGNRKLNIVMTLFSVVLLCCASVAQATVPEEISYQGQLTDAVGAPLEGTYDVWFYLYDAPSGGILLWDEQQSVVVTDGIYNVQLGAVSPLEVTVFSGNTVYLEVVIYNPATTTWETLAPRQQLTSTAYAFQAENAQSLEGYGSADFAPALHEHSGDDITSGIIDEAYMDPDIARDAEITWGNLSGIPADIADGDQVGITAETDPTVDSSVKDGVSWGELSGIPAGFADNIDDVGLTVEIDPQVGSNITNRIPIWNGSALVTGSIYDNGSIGIGTTNPEYKLDVRGGRIRLKEDATGDWIAMRTDGDALDLQFEGGSLYFQGTADGDHILLNPTRNSFVGIGTEAPQSSLNILGGHWDVINTEGDFKIGGPTNRLKMGIARGGLGAGTANIIAQGGVNQLNLGSGDELVLSIKNGSVGIQNQNPAEELDVNGDVQASGDFHYASARTYYLNMPAAAFRKNEYHTTIWANPGTYAYILGTVDNIYVHSPVYLPQGARVTEVRFYYYDNDYSGNVSFTGYLVRRGNTQEAPLTMAAVSTSSSGYSTAILSEADTTISSATIDNANYVYWVSVDWDADVAGSGLRFYSCRLQYALTTLAP
jgi:hypothetical protein